MDLSFLHPVGKRKKKKKKKDERGKLVRGEMVWIVRDCDFINYLYLIDLIKLANHFFCLLNSFAYL